MKKYKDTMVSLVLAIIMVIFIWHNFLIGGNNIIFVFGFICSFNFIKKTINIKDKRANIITIIVSIIFTLIEIICKSIDTDYTLNNIINKWLIVNFIGYFTICWTAIKWFFSLYERKNQNTTNECRPKLIKNEYLFFIICFVLIILAWIPYFLNYFPGIITPDSYTQIEQTIGISELSDHHPIAHTAIISVCINLGLMIFNNINLAIAIYSIVSMILMACMDAIVLLYLRKKNTSPVILGLLLVFYMFYPVNALYSITMWKDILFSGIFPVFLILCSELIFNTREFFKYKKNMILFIIISFLMIVLRHNGLYVVFLTIPFFYIVLKQYWRKFSIMLVSIIAINLIFNLIMFNGLKIKKGSVGEILSVPLQQIARVEKEHRDELTSEESDRITPLFKFENIGNYYNPTLSDPVKDKINNDYFENNKIDFIKIWTKLLLKYPKDYIEAFICNSYGYYYPEAKNWVVSRATMDHSDMGIERQSKIDGKIVEKIDSYVDKREIPLISMMFSVGFVFWIIVICFGYKIYKKEYKYIFIYLPIFILWLTCIASPVFCEFRYAYPLFTTLGLYISWNLMPVNCKKEKSQ